MKVRGIKTSRILLSLIIAVVAITSSVVLNRSAEANGAQLRILTLCDSITASGQYQVELGRLLAVANVPHTFINSAVSGSGVEYWATHITEVMDAAQPDLVLLNCGTNDTWTVSHDVANFEAKYRTIVEGILNWRTPDRVKLGVSFIAYGTYPATQTFIDNQPAVNSAIGRQLPLYSSLITGIADFQQIPPNNLYLDSSGFHPTSRGYKAMARIWYDALAPGMGWPPSQEPPLCGMDGTPLLRGYSRRIAIACEGQ